MTTFEILTLMLLSLTAAGVWGIVWNLRAHRSDTRYSLNSIRNTLQPSHAQIIRDSGTTYGSR